MKSKIPHFEVSVSLGAFIVTHQAKKKIKNYYTLPIALANYCKRASVLN
jgi:hypothetical protein